MSEMKEKRLRRPPYVAAGVLWEFFNKLKFVAVPSHLDAKELEEYGVPKHWTYHLLSTLKFLKLVEKNGKTTPALQSLQMRGDEFKNNLQEVIRNAYADVFLKIDPARDSRANILNFFMKHYGTSPSGADKATTLLLDLCNEAGIPVAEQAKKEAAKAVTETARKVRAKTGERGAEVKIETGSTSSLREIYAHKLIESDLNVTIGPGMDAEAIKAAREALRERHDAIKEILDQLEKQ